MKDIIKKLTLLEEAPPQLKGTDKITAPAKPVSYDRPHPTKGKFVGGENEENDEPVVAEDDISEEKIYSKIKRDFADFLEPPKKSDGKFRSDDKADDAIDAVDNDELKETPLRPGDLRQPGMLQRVATAKGISILPRELLHRVKQSTMPEYNVRELEMVLQGADERPLFKRDLEELATITGTDYSDLCAAAGINESEVEEDISKQGLDYVKRVCDELWEKLDIDVRFTKHFLERVNDRRNGKPITVQELIQLFKKEYFAYGDKIRDLDDRDEAVLNDLFTKINVPFVIQQDRQGEKDLVAKTIMRKPDFKTNDPKFQVEGWFGQGLKKERLQAERERAGITTLVKLIEKISKDLK